MISFCPRCEAGVWYGIEHRCLPITVSSGTNVTITTGDPGTVMGDMLSHACPACGAEPGEQCNTIVDGVQTHWTHDARVYVDLFVAPSGDLRAGSVVYIKGRRFVISDPITWMGETS